MSFEIIIKKEAQADLVKLYHSEPKAFNKAQQLLEELRSHPRTGIGRPEQLKGSLMGVGVVASSKSIVLCMRFMTTR